MSQIVGQEKPSLSELAHSATETEEPKVKRETPSAKSPIERMLADHGNTKVSQIPSS